MMKPNQPLVSVVTPVRNGAAYLAECIESVLNQTYDAWDYIIVNNFSTDDSLEIARSYAERDSRIRIHDNVESLPQMPNWNHAMRQISADSRYCKVVHADDALFPTCLEKMVDLAEAHPTVGFVGALRLSGTTVEPAVPPAPEPRFVIHGRSAGRSYLTGGPYIFGSPTTTLIRSDLVRAQDPFYNERNLHADTEACLAIASHSDYGFVNEVLTFTRRHAESISATAVSRVTTALHRYHVQRHYAPAFFDEPEIRSFLKRATQSFYVRLWKSLILVGPSVWAAHRSGLEALGYRMDYHELLEALPYLILNRHRSAVEPLDLRGAGV